MRDIDGRAPSRAALISLDRQTCLGLLATHSIGRLIFTRRALPDVLPVNYLLVDADVIVRLASGSAAALVVTNSVAAFEVDEIDVTSGTGWSVTIVGHVREVTDPVELGRVATELQSRAGDGRDHFIAVATEKVTGRRLL